MARSVVDLVRLHLGPTKGQPEVGDIGNLGVVMDTPDTHTYQTWQRLSPRYRLLRHLEVGLLTVLALIIGVSLGFVYASIFDVVPIILGVAVPLIGGAVADFFVIRRANAWAYCERDEDLWVRRGLLVRRLSVIPYGRMQFVEVSAGPIERIFKMATVQLHTAAAATDARIPGLDETEARRLRDQLAALGESRLSGL